MFELIQKFTGALFIVIPLIWLVLYFYSKGAGANRSKDKSELMEIVTTLPMGPKKVVSVVNVAGQYLVLGVGPESINYLTSIEDPSAVEKLNKGLLNTSQGRLKKVLNFRRSKGSFNLSGLLRGRKSKG